MTRIQLRTIVVAIIVLCTCCLTLLSLRPGHNWGDDFALYINQAQSLATGKLDTLIQKNTFTTYVSSFEPGSVLYPWGYPLVLTVMYLITGFNLFAFKLLNVWFLGLSLIPLYLLFKDKFKYKYTVLFLLALFGFSATLTTFADNVISDLFFLFVSNVFLWLCFRFIVDSKYFVNKYVSLIVLAGITFLAYLIRTNGILLLMFLGLVCVDKVWRDRKEVLASYTKYIKRNLHLTLPFALFVVSYLVFFKIFPDETGSHLRLLKDVNWNSLATNIGYYFNLPLEFFQTAVVYAIALGLFIVGMFKYVKKYYLLLIYFCLILGMYIVWPSRQGIRFVFPAIPVFLFFALLGSEFVFSRIKFKSWNLHMLVPLLLVVSFLIPTVTVAYAGIHQTTVAQIGPYAPGATELWDFIETKTPADAVIIFYKPRILTLITGRESAFIAYENQILNVKPQYVVINKSLGVSGDQITMSESIVVAKMPIIFENAQFAVYHMQY